MFNIIESPEISESVVTSISTSINSDLLAVSTWRNSAWIINITDDLSAPTSMKISFESPCLANKFHPKVNTRLYSVDLNGGLFVADSIKNNNTIIDNTNLSFDKISFLKDHNLVLINDSSPTLKLYRESFLGDIKTQGKVVSMDAKGNLIILATSTGKFIGYDIRSPYNKLFSIKNGIKGVVMDLKINKKCNKFTVSSSDGRIGVYSLKGPKDILGTIFKGHKLAWKGYNGIKLHGNQNFVCPITSLAYPLKEDIVASAGLDGFINIWNLQINKRVNLMSDLKSQSISHIQFTEDGRKLISCVSPVVDCNIHLNNNVNDLSCLYLRNIDDKKDLGRY